MTLDDATLDGRLHKILDDYYEAIESGEEPNRGEWIAHHPDHADDLAAFFAGQNQLRRVIGPLRQPTPTLQSFRDYEIVREISRGGMGVVHETHQRSLNRPMALKMILSGSWASEDDLRGFPIEAESAAALDHPNIVPIYEVGQHENRP